MPKGIVTVRWDDTQGTVLHAKYPDDLQLTADEMMRIFTSHAMGEGKAGFMSMKLEAMNVASYYTGLAARGEPQYYVALVLGSDEDASIFEEPLTEAAKDLLSKLKLENYTDFLTKTYTRLTEYVKLTDEQRVALIISDPVRKTIFRRLMESCTSKLELQEWLEQELGTPISDIDLLLVPLIKSGIVKKAVVEGITGDCIFLLRDVFAAFVPPETIMTKILKGEIKGSIARSSKKEITEFFRKREPSEDEPEKVAEIITDLTYYKIISQLRKSIADKEELAKQAEKPASEVGKQIKALVKLGIVGELTDSFDNNVYLLKADPQISLFFPEYMIDNVRAKWSSGEISREMAVKYLQLLKEEFLAPTEPPTEKKK
jgi:hypothetical protein